MLTILNQPVFDYPKGTIGTVFIYKYSRKFRPLNQENYFGVAEIQYDIIHTPLRVGKKQKRAVLDSRGHEIALFKKGMEGAAQLTCNMINGLKK